MQPPPEARVPVLLHPRGTGPSTLCPIRHRVALRGPQPHEVLTHGLPEPVGCEQTRSGQ